MISQPMPPFRRPPPALPAQPKGAPPTVCYSFNVGKCQSTTCPRGFVHRCSICGALHPANTVPSCKGKIDAAGKPIRYTKKKTKGGK